MTFHRPHSQPAGAAPRPSETLVGLPEARDDPARSAATVKPLPRRPHSHDGDPHHTGAHSYLLPGVPHVDHPDRDYDHPDRDYQVELAKPPYAASIVSADLGGDSELLFNGYGFPDSAATIVIQSGSRQKTITVDPDTGGASAQ